jgi:hypothetical protein
MTAADAHYLAFLRARDGDASLPRHRLAAREAFFERLASEPVRAARAVDGAAFRRNVLRRRPEPGLDRQMLWLLATAKTNQAERFAVGLAELYGKMDVRDEVVVRVSLQEHYHTRLLADAVGLFGLEIVPTPPAGPVRWFIKLLLALPERWRLPVAGASEMAGCILFRALRDEGAALFSEEPAVAARIRLLYDEILADELGHVGHIASRLGRFGRAVTRGLYRLLGPRFAGAMPELVGLFGPGLRRQLAAPFPLVAMADELPDRALVVAAM